MLLLVSLMLSCASHNNGAAHNLEATAVEPMRLEGLELVWTLSLGSNSLAGDIASDPTKEVIYAIHPGFKIQEMKSCSEIDSHGSVIRTFKYRRGNGLLRTARLRSDKSCYLVIFERWDYAVATDTSGKTLWTQKCGGIDDIAITDLNGDGLDEVVVGYNGSTGLHVLDGHGKLLWKNQQEGNVWHVCAADLDGDGKPEVVSTSAKGKVRVFRADGTRLPDIEPPPGYYANLVRPIKLSDSGRSEGIFLTGHGTRVAALQGDGKPAWERELPTSFAGGGR